MECLKILRDLKFSGLVTLFPMSDISDSEICELLLCSDLPITIVLPSISVNCSLEHFVFSLIKP